ncbi:MAG: hypothetical protein ACF8PG_12965 [Maioricimonas sp. JB045]
MIRHVLLDLDGVIVDFVSKALVVHRQPDLIDRWPPGVWDMHTLLGITKRDFWGPIDQIPGFWEQLPPYPWKDELIATIEQVAPFTVATSPSRNPACPSQKVAWMHRHIRESFHDFLIGRQKWLMARPDTVLIDDCDANIEAFRKHGGKAITFPQPWNSNHALTGDRIAYVREALAELQG